MLLFCSNIPAFPLSDFFWSTTCRWHYRGSPWQHNHFVVITLHQQQPSGYILFDIKICPIFKLSRFKIASFINMQIIHISRWKSLSLSIFIIQGINICNRWNGEREEDPCLPSLISVCLYVDKEQSFDMVLTRKNINQCTQKTWAWKDRSLSLKLFPSKWMLTL